MALYDYNCKNCGATFELSKKISERDDVADDVCPECSTVGQIERGLSAPMVSYTATTGGYGKPSDGFKEVLQRIHSRAPGSQMDKTSSFM